MKAIYEAICCTVILIASGNLWADFMYDPLNPRPTESDVWAAEHNARQHSQNAIEHNQKAVEAMGRDSWRSIEEQQRANEEQQRASRARRDADEMRNRIWQNEQEDRRREEERREERQREEEEEWSRRQRQSQEEEHRAIEQVTVRELTPEEQFAEQVRSLQPTPYRWSSAPPGCCFMCGARLLGRQRKCERCKRHAPKQYEDWKAREEVKAARLKQLLTENRTLVNGIDGVVEKTPEGSSQTNSSVPVPWDYRSSLTFAQDYANYWMSNIRNAYAKETLRAEAMVKWQVYRQLSDNINKKIRDKDGKKMSYDEFDKFVRGLLSVVLDAERCYSDRCGFMHFGRSNSDSTEGCREAFALPVQIYAYKKMAQAVERMRQLKKKRQDVRFR